MTDLRDARLRRALDEAPDASLRPLPRTREAVLEAARSQAAPRPWWRRLWAPAAGASRMQWNAAFATVLVAGLVSVLWQGQEVPDAQPERVARPAPAAAPAAQDAAPAKKESAESGAVVAERAAPAAPPIAGAVPGSGAPATVPAPSKAKAAPEAEGLRGARESRAARERQDAAAAAPPEAPPPAPAELAKQPAREEKQTTPLQDRAASGPGHLAEAPPTAPLAAPPLAAGAAARPPPAVAAAAPASPRAATAAADSRAGANLQRRAFNESAVAGAWTQLQVEGAGRTLSLSRAEAGRLAQDIEGVLRAPGGSAALAEEPEIRVRLLEGERPVGTLTIGRSQWLWAPAGAEPGAARLLEPGPALVQSLRAELERRLR
ncbi:hypothetical protein FN976_24750 [Caenimonas sedimenti]|uniref:Meckel syndrome type 1 protein n=1 Tax=Caenimonas sedimenti TaxID=2596921 RepID=A0A562ZI23_9BURK|nr:hypothetical protein [Caenimonas sedimenti]TWO67844.1 hypothetical protein FN976_24750 [Caenimonas sedimenti]